MPTRKWAARCLWPALLAGTSLLMWTDPSSAEIGVPQHPTYNMFGGVGLLDMPTSRFAPDGEFSAAFSAMSSTMEHYEFGFQALPWLETTFRYSRLDQYLPSGGDLYDRSLGIKIRLSQEDEYWPSISVGAIDILGTGAFGGEYFVASKRFGDIDVSAGLGWRGLAGFGTISNPFGQLSDSFKHESSSVSTGAPLLKDFFHGARMGFFGGVSWETPIDGLSLMAEVSGESYSRERHVGALDYRSPLNFGFSYQVMDNLQIGGGYLYGSEYGLRLTVYLDPLAPEPPSRLGSKPLPVTVRSPEERKDAVLSYVQDQTHFYDNWPGNPIQKTVSAIREEKQPLLADLLFESAVENKLSISDVETFGGSLLITTSGRANAINCASFERLTKAAHAQGLNEIVFDTGHSAAVRVCPFDSMKDEETAAANEPLRLASTSDPISLPQAPTPAPIPEGETSPFDAASLEKQIVDGAEEQNIGIVAINVEKTRISVAYANNTYRTNAEAIGRLLRLLMKVAPNSVERFQLVATVGNLPSIGVSFNRSDIERTLNMYGDAADLLPLSDIVAVDSDDPLLESHRRTEFPAFQWSLTPGYHQSLFDPQQPYRFEVYADLRGSVDLSPHWSLGAGVEYDIYDTFDITRQSDSLLPHVRSDFASYYKHGSNGIAYLQAGYFDKLTPNVYV
ncbi:MAG TPA: YjbH domain-containing protein, partial [Lacipirellulaceae bacterium]|nr:YjbH domain-containing protein [Lacipirellulaceae bacterium]